MIIVKDKSLVNQKLIDCGYANIDIHSITFDRYYSESEMEENRKTSEALNAPSEEWSNHCDSVRRKIAEQISPIIERIHKSFMLWGFDEENEIKFQSDDWVLHFWCGDLYDVTHGKCSGRDISHVVLTFNDRMNHQEREGVVNNISELLADSKSPNVKMIIRYTTKMNAELVEKEAAKKYEEIKDKKVLWDDRPGTIKMIAGNYAFFKARTRKNYYVLPPIEICMNVNIASKQ